MSNQAVVEGSHLGDPGLGVEASPFLLIRGGRTLERPACPVRFSPGRLPLMPPLMSLRPAPACHQPLNGHGNRNGSSKNSQGQVSLPSGGTRDLRIKPAAGDYRRAPHFSPMNPVNARDGRITSAPRRWERG